MSDNSNAPSDQRLLDCNGKLIDSYPDYRQDSSMAWFTGILICE